MSGPPPVYPPSAEEREYAQHYAARAASPSYAYSYGLDESGPSHVPPQSQSSRVPIPSRMESGDSVYSHATPTMGSTYPPRVQRVPSTDGKDHPSTSGQPARKYGPEYPEGWTDEDMAAEAEFLKKGMIEWRDVLNWRFWIRLKWWYWYLALIIIGVLVVLMVVYHDQIVKWCRPAADWMKNLPGGWAIPIGIMFVLSFPPLFGHEIVAVICGLVWGLWIGFGIVAAGTFIGEVGNYYAFKYCCRSRAEKHERKNMAYACLAYVMREGSFWIVIAARLSAIPGHLTTAVFSTCGMSIWVFMIGAFITLPKQLVTVYLGVLFDNKGQSKKDKIISYSVLAIGVLITFGAAWWIWYEMHKVRIVVWRRRRMEMASRGIALNSVRYDDHAKAELGASETLDEAARPMLARRSSNTYPSSEQTSNPYLNPSPQRQRTSYQTPYDMSYKRTDDMSVYNVDAMHERMDMEADIADRLRARSPPLSGGQGRAPSYTLTDPGVVHASSTGTQAFPESHPTGIRRAPSSPKPFYQPGEEHVKVIESQFPSAAPYRGNHGDLL